MADEHAARSSRAETQRNIRLIAEELARRTSKEELQAQARELKERAKEFARDKASDLRDQAREKAAETAGELKSAALSKLETTKEKAMASPKALAAVGALAGAGLGAVLGRRTPLLAMAYGTKLAVAVVSVPHLVGTTLRFSFIWRHVNRRVLLSFGVASAAGGLTGALLHVWLRSAWLGYTLGILLVFAGTMGLTGLASRMRFGGAMAWVAGVLSGGFGGLVGNQGGIRSAALLTFDLKKEEFVATATGIALAVDFFRMPVYGVTQWREVASVWPILLVATAGIVFGTIVGQPVLRRVPPPTFRAIVSGIILLLGIWMLLHPGA